MRTDPKCVRLVLFCLMLLPLQGVMGQSKIRKLSTMINHPSLNLYAPYISADANAVIFLSDNAEDHALTPFFSYRERADWKEPQVLPKIINTRLNFLRGYGLSADGTTLYFSTMKSPGVGGFDICTSEWRGGSAWTNPANLGAPINSRLHEACPSVTPDGKTLYFMRCNRMDQNTAEGCKLFRVDKQPNGIWGDPVALPESINTGNSQTPRIMADGETLIFSSDQMGNSRGGMDLYLTKFRDGGWSTPVPLDFVNTEKHDQYVSVAGLGRYLLRDSPGTRKSELVEYLIPDHLRPRGMMKIEGNVADETGKPLQAYISLVDVTTGARIYNGRPNSDGRFLLYAMEGSRYELSVDPEHGNKTYFCRTLDLTVDPIPQVEKVEAVLKSVVPGDEFILSGIAFRENSAEIDMASSQRELQRFVRMVTSNQDLNFEVQVLFEGYEEDSIQSRPDLTEVRIDTVHWLYIDIDTLGQLYERDTASLNVVYHNDRSVHQVRSIIDYLISRGAPEGRVAGFAKAVPAILPGDRRTLVKARVATGM
jgi:hypothetical protein